MFGNGHVADSECDGERWVEREVGGDLYSIEAVSSSPEPAGIQAIQIAVRLLSRFRARQFAARPVAATPLARA